MGLGIRLDHDRLEAMFEPWNRSDAPGLAVAVAHPKAGLWKRAYGLASVEIPVANTVRTRMRIGSVSKMFTSLAVMLLAEEGKLSIDDSVGRHFPELPRWADAMKLRQLMDHSSGMRCHLDLLLQTGGWGRPAPATALATLMRQPEVNHPPGTRWNYNNSGYNLLSLLVERLSEGSFEDYLERRIFAPLGMVDSAVKRSDCQLLPNSASLHARGADGAFHRGFFGPQIAGEGAIVSTAEDLLVWLRHLRRPVIGSAETWRRMVTPVPLADGGLSGYALGLSVLDYRGARIWCHAGGVVGGVAMCLTAPDLDLDVVILANRDDIPVQLLAFEIVDACIDGLEPLPPPFAAPPLCGLYLDETGGLLLRLENKNGDQVLKLAGTEIPVVRRGETRLASGHAALDLTVDARPDGGLIVRARGNCDRFLPVPELAGPADVQAVVGIYLCSEVECLATIEAAGEGLTMRMDGPYGRDLYRLDPVGRGLWESRCTTQPLAGLGGTIAFDRGGTGFTLSTPRTRKLPFLRLEPEASRPGLPRSLPPGSA